MPLRYKSYCVPYTLRFLPNSLQPNGLNNLSSYSEKKVIKEILFRAAERARIPLVLVANKLLRPRHPAISERCG